MSSYDPIYKYILGTIDNILEVSEDIKKLLETIGTLNVKEPKAVKKDEYSGFAIDGSMVYLLSPHLVLYDVKSAAIPINLKKSTKSAENIFIMIPSKRVRRRVATKMSTLEAFMGLYAVNVLTSSDKEKRVVLVDGLLTTPIHIILREIYYRLLNYASSNELVWDTIKDAYNEIKNHWLDLEEKLQETNVLLPTKDIPTLFYSESGKREILERLAGDSSPEEIQNALFILEHLENLVLRELMLKRALENRISVVGISKRSLGYSLYKILKELRGVNERAQRLERILGVNDAMYVIYLIGKYGPRYVYSPVFYKYFEEPQSKRVRKAAEVLKDKLSGLFDMSTEISLLATQRNSSNELEKYFHAGYARFSYYSRIYKFEALVRDEELEDLMGWLYSISKTGYPEFLKVADTLAHRTKDSMSALHGTLVDFIKKYSKHPNYMIKEVLEPYREALASRKSIY